MLRNSFAFEQLAETDEPHKSIEARHCMFALKNEAFEQCEKI